MRVIVMLLCALMSTFVHANKAVDEINQIIAQKTLPQKNHERAKLMTEKQKKLSENYYFIFVFKATCPHCQKFSPVLKDFADNFHIDVKAYSFDGGPSKEFNSKPLTAKLFKTLYVDGNFKPSVPALYLANRYTMEVYPVLFGEAQDYELARRVSNLLSHIEERFHA